MGQGRRLKELAGKVVGLVLARDIQPLRRDG
jgi:hypothetical protein